MSVLLVVNTARRVSRRPCAVRGAAHAAAIHDLAAATARDGAAITA